MMAKKVTKIIKLALAVGNLEARDIGPRSRVWSEPETVAAGEYEFAETEDFLVAAENVAGLDPNPDMPCIRQIFGA